MYTDRAGRSRTGVLNQFESNTLKMVPTASLYGTGHKVLIVVIGTDDMKAD